MVDNRILDQISKGIRAAEHVRNAYNANLRAGSGTPAGYDKVSVLYDTLAAIADFYPGTSRSSFSEALEKSNNYCGHYRNAKNHFKSMRTGEPGSKDVVKALKVLAPMLGSRSSATIDKILLMLEILNS